MQGNNKVDNTIDHISQWPEWIQKENKVTKDLSMVLKKFGHTKKCFRPHNNFSHEKKMHFDYSLAKNKSKKVRKVDPL